jgi:hypothetical protein
MERLPLSTKNLQSTTFAFSYKVSSLLSLLSNYKNEAGDMYTFMTQIRLKSVPI